MPEPLFFVALLPDADLEADPEAFFDLDEALFFLDDVLFFDEPPDLALDFPFAPDFLPPDFEPPRVTAIATSIRKSSDGPPAHQSATTFGRG